MGIDIMEKNPMNVTDNIKKAPSPRKKYIQYLKAVLIIFVGFIIINYLLDRLSLQEALGFGTGLFLGLLLLISIIEYNTRRKKAKQSLQ